MRACVPPMIWSLSSASSARSAASTSLLAFSLSVGLLRMFFARLAYLQRVAFVCANVQPLECAKGLRRMGRVFT